MKFPNYFSAKWSDQLQDMRGKRVIFLSHCLLNENTRYLGGARHPGLIPEIVQPCIDNGIGIVQMPCPEQCAWGGVIKRKLLAFYGSKGKLRYKFRRLLLPIALWYTRNNYRKLAYKTANMIQDYQKSGYKVLGVVGVDASPSCGVTTTLNLPDSLTLLGNLMQKTTSADDVNQIVRKMVINGQGLYIRLLQRILKKRGINIPFSAHDIIGELDEKPSSANIQAMIIDK